MKKLICAAAALCLSAAPAFAATKILFVGNSFTFAAHSPAMHYETDQVHDLNPPDALGRTIGGVPALFKEFTKEAGLDYDVSLETVGGKGFDYHMAEKKAVLNVTVAESVADAVRQEAMIRNVTISSVVEAALAEQLKWLKIRADGLAAIEEEFQETGYPTPEEEAAARAAVDKEERLLAEMLAAERRESGAA